MSDCYLDTAEPWYPIPDDEPYGALDDPPSNLPDEEAHPLGELTAGGSSSVPAHKAALRAPAAGALPLCPNCKTEVDEDFYCVGCGKQLPLNIDRPSHPPIPEPVRGPEGEQSND